MNSIGIGSGGGVGKVTAEWLITGHINEDIFNYDIKRFQKFHSELGFIKDRITDLLGICMECIGLINNIKHQEM